MNQCAPNAYLLAAGATEDQLKLKFSEETIA
jgi:hypothetical protein